MNAALRRGMPADGADTALIDGFARRDTTQTASPGLTRFGSARRSFDHREQRLPLATPRAWAAVVGRNGLIDRLSKSGLELIATRKDRASMPQHLRLIGEHPTRLRRTMLVRQSGPSYGFSNRLRQSLFDSVHRS